MIIRIGNLKYELERLYLPISESHSQKQFAVGRNNNNNKKRRIAERITCFVVNYEKYYTYQLSSHKIKSRVSWSNLRFIFGYDVLHFVEVCFHFREFEFNEK